MIEDVRISSSGCILLAGDVACDGFFRDSRIRVQTHVHSDHMEGFESSKAFQTIVASRGTHALLCAQLNADLPYRSNFVATDFGVTNTIDGVSVTLESSGHMLGAAQVAVAHPDGTVLGYSGDFSWPLERVVNVDVLVVDPTYGSPESVREYSQGQAEKALLSAIRRARNLGPVRLCAHQGTLQRALQVMSGEVDVPVVGSRSFVKEVAVYREFGCVIDDVFDASSAEGREILKSRRYVHVFGTGDALPIPDGEATTIKLSAFMVQPGDPVLKLSDRSLRIAMTNHADFNGTLEYIAATGAKTVVVDSSRGVHAYKLAESVESRLGVQCLVPEVDNSREWGR